MNYNKTIFENHHGTIDFPINVAYNDSKFNHNNTGNFIHCHWHKEYEINLVTRGTVVFEVNATPVEVREGEALFINSTDIHTGYTTDDSQCCLYAIIFNIEILSSSRPDLCQNKYVDPFIKNLYKFPSLIKNETGWQADIISQIRKAIYAYDEKDFGFELKIKTCILNILSEVVSSRSFTVDEESSDFKRKRLKKFKEVLKYIEKNYANKIYIQELAAVAEMSADNFYKYFRSISGITPLAYINHYRINEACKLLEENKLQVLDVSLNTGFENFSFFIKTFKKSKGCTPNVYRKDLLKGSQMNSST